MGIEALLAPFLGKLIVGGVALFAILIAWLGFKSKYKSQGMQEQAQKDAAAQVQAKEALQAKVDNARGQDSVIDKKTQMAKEQIKAELAKTKPAKPVGEPKVGDQFKFCWLAPLFLLSALLFSCATTQDIPVVAKVRVEIPARPELPACPEVPHPVGRVVQTDAGMGVLLPLNNAQAIAAYLRDAPACQQIRELELLGHVEKLENRLKAVGQ